MRILINNTVWAYLLAVALFASSCRQPANNTVISSFNETAERAQSILLDTTSTFEQLIDTVIPFADSLLVAAQDEDNKSRRLAAQEFASYSMNLLVDHIARLNSDGQNLTSEQAEALLNPFVEVLNQWFYIEDEYSCLWRDMYFVSHRMSEEPVDDSFEIYVILPDEASGQASVHIFFPWEAESSPELMFSNIIEEMDGEESYDVVHFEEGQWGAPREDYPLTAFGGQDIVDKMLEYDSMYMIYRSPTAPDGVGIGRMSLLVFHEKYKALVK